MKTARPHPSRQSGFTLVEVMVSMTIAALVLGGTMATFMFALRTMYKDTERLATNATLRYFIAQISKETLDATEFYVFPNYQSLDGDVDPIDDVSSLEADGYGTFLAYGDCVVLVTRTSINTSANIRQIRIYYRETTTPATIAPVRFYQSVEYNDDGNAATLDGTDTSLAELLNTINLKSYPKINRSRQMVAKARGRLKSGTSSTYYPIFSTESANNTPTNESVSINVEVINGSSVNNVLSSSSFNYTISPRK